MKKIKRSYFNGETIDIVLENFTMEGKFRFYNLQNRNDCRIITLTFFY